MDTFVTYARRTLEDFHALDINPVDSLILCWFSYYSIPDSFPTGRSWEGIHLHELYRAEDFDHVFRAVWDYEDARTMLSVLAASPRFRNIRVKGAVEDLDNDAQKQFAAMTFQITEDLAYVAFRGTDSTFVGWKEDFNMAFRWPIPAQEAALRYLEEAAEHTTGRLHVGGHSKGGNLAVYASALANPDVGARLEKVHSHDGPGFLGDFLDSAQYHTIAPKIDKTVPHASIVGMLMERQEDYRVVKCSGLGLWHHYPFTWEVADKDFAQVDDLSPDARYMDRTINEWLAGLSIEERERFIDSLYSVVQASEATTFVELRDDWRHAVPTILHTVQSLDQETKDFLLRTLRALGSVGVKLFPRLKLPVWNSLWSRETSGKSTSLKDETNESNESGDETERVSVKKGTSFEA